MKSWEVGRGEKNPRKAGSASSERKPNCSAGGVSPPGSRCAGPCFQDSPPARYNSGMMEQRSMSDSIEPKVVHDAGEAPLVLRSNVRAPLAHLSFLRRSLALAELAMIAYNDE